MMDKYEQRGLIMGENWHTPKEREKINEQAIEESDVSSRNSDRTNEAFIRWDEDDFRIRRNNDGKE
jgi:hypothetical protein